MSTAQPDCTINLVIDLAKLLHVDETRLAKDLTGASRVFVLVPFRHIGNAAWNIDIAWDYLAALFVGETIAPLCHEIYCTIQWIKVGISYGRVQFELYPDKVESLAEKLLWLSHQFDNRAEAGEFDVEDLHWEVDDAIREFRAELDGLTLRFPDLAERYSANMVPGMPQINDDLGEYYGEYPERKHDFWRSHYSNIIGAEFYTSTDYIGAYIVPAGVDVDQVLRKSDAMSPDAPELRHARLLTGKNLAPAVFNEIVMVQYPARAVSLAQACARDIWPAREGTPAMSFRLNDIGDVLVADDGLAQYVIFSPSPKKVPDVATRPYLIEAEQSTEALRTYLGIPTRMACPWDRLDDEKFEQLCYDVVYYCGRYDRTTIRKMGKSRSRDGGRDIEALSMELHNGRSIKWIFQCKFTKGNGSVAGSKVNVSDTIDQYGAGGFCIMTNSTIDSTLFDKMDGIRRNRGLEVTHWSRNELERFLAEHREIRDRYFK